jgi:hypothetical protein
MAMKLGHSGANQDSTELRSVEIERRRKRYGKVEPGEHSNLVQKLLRDYATAKELADAGPPRVNETARDE